MNALETYLEELHAIRISGGAVKETSYYPALSNLLNEVGKSLKPRVRCIINIQNAGAGLPDGGLYAAEQFQKQSKGELREGQLPARGAIEVKSTGEEVKNIAGSEQVMRYVNRYKQVLVTNLRDFVLVGVDHEGKVTNRESFSLAPNEKAFWLAASHHSATAEHRGAWLVHFALLRRDLPQLQGVPLRRFIRTRSPRSVTGRRVGGDQDYRQALVVRARGGGEK